MTPEASPPCGAVAPTWLGNRRLPGGPQPAHSAGSPRKPDPRTGRGRAVVGRLRPFTLARIAAIVLVTHHATAVAQSVDSAVSPILPPDAAEFAGAKPKRDYAHTAIGLRIVLPQVDAASKRAGGAAQGNQPLQIGFHRAIPDEYQGDLSALMEWTPLADGSIVSAVSVTSPDALALRVGIRAELGSGGQVRFFGGGSSAKDGVQDRAPQVFPVMTRADFQEDGETEAVWSPVVEGDTIGIEVTMPSREARSDLSFRIEKVSHIHAPMQRPGHTRKDLECSNHVDVRCRSSAVGDRQDAVGLIVYERDGGTFLCSGTLLNDTRDDGYIPYFLTAHHCVSTEPVARSVEARWFYQRASCGSERIDARDETTYGGTDLLAASAAQDSTLLRFRRSLPGGLTYSGWSADPVTHPTRVYGVHHPGGDVKKFSAGRTLRHEDTATHREGIVVAWSEGTTEGGSSGSGLFDGESLIGVLSGGRGTCTSTIDIYGSFRGFFPRIRRWLSPAPQSLPFVTAASNRSRPGFVRIVNHSEGAGTVAIRAIDDSGERFGPVSLRLEAREAVHFSSADLEKGNADKGLPAGVGDGTGNWRLELSSGLAIEALAYIRTPDGFVTSMHEVAAAVDQESNRYHVPFVNPGSNPNQQSLLRLINPGSGSAGIVITGVDDAGDEAPLGEVSLTLEAGASRMLSVRDLERGGTGLSGRLGDGTGKWRLSVSGDRPLQVMSLLQLPTGHLANLSRGRDEVAVWVPPEEAPDLVVTNYSVSHSPKPGQTLTVRATVRNQGNVRSAATTLRWLSSTNRFISTTDEEEGTSSVGGIAPSGASAESSSFRVPRHMPLGPFYAGACVDPVPGESDTANNCSNAVPVNVIGREGFRFGAIAADFEVSQSCPGVAAGISVDRGSEQAALDAAHRACRSDGGSAANCRSGSRSFQQCVGLAYGADAPSSDCGLALGSGSTRGAAESAALARCRSEGFRVCRIWVNGSGQRISGCNFRSNSAAGTESPGRTLFQMQLKGLGTR